MKSNYLNLFQVILIACSLLSCKPASEYDGNLSASVSPCHPIETTPVSDLQEYTNGEMSKFLNERQLLFLNTLSIKPVIQSIKNELLPSHSAESTILDIFVYFNNTSSEDIVVRSPIAVGFNNDAGIVGGMLFDLTIYLDSKNGTVGALNASDILNTEAIELSSFFKIKKGRACWIEYNLTLPPFVINKNGYYSLPANTYTLTLEYRNFMIGYSVPLLEDPPSNMSAIEQIAWLNSKRKQVDINAWVGRVYSESVEFSLP